MPHLTITVDGETLMDGDLGQWDNSPSPLTVEQLTVDPTPKPWMLGMMGAFAHAAATQQDTAITVVTSSNGWSIKVTQR
jgi:hypothetical protein